LVTFRVLVHLESSLHRKHTKKACWYLKNGIAYLILWEVPIAYLKFRHLGQSLSIPYILLVWQGFHGYIR
jgi:uncharacterized membrane protein YhdT